jgi:hypothetical protein
MGHTASMAYGWRVHTHKPMPVESDVGLDEVQSRAEPAGVAVPMRHGAVTRAVDMEAESRSRGLSTWRLNRGHEGCRHGG